MEAPRPATLKTVARKAGVSVSAASYALRGAPNIPAETSARVRAAAEALGYRPNARVAELMAHIRGARPPPASDHLALVWPENAPAPGGFLHPVVSGARARATERGYVLDEFHLDAMERKPHRLAEILRARGIAGVVFAPAQIGARVELDWPWDRFAMAVVGTAEWNVVLSRAAHHHYEGMRLALDGLARAGSRRPAAIIDRVTNERAHRGWQGAWLAYAPGDDANERLLLTDPGRDDPGSLARWLKRARPDALAIGSMGALGALREAGWRDTPENTASLSWSPGQKLPGVDQGYELIAGHAVDLVIAQLHRNERGLPGTPRTLLFAGRWVGPSSPAISRTAVPRSPRPTKTAR